jgi:hypothetical protein
MPLTRSAGPVRHGSSRACLSYQASILFATVDAVVSGEGLAMSVLCAKRRPEIKHSLLRVRTIIMAPSASAESEAA